MRHYVAEIEHNSAHRKVAALGHGDEEKLLDLLGPRDVGRQVGVQGHVEIGPPERRDALAHVPAGPQRGRLRRHVVGQLALQALHLCMHLNAGLMKALPS